MSRAEWADMAIVILTIAIATATLAALCTSS